MNDYPRIGVAVFLWRGGKFLMQRRGRGCGTGTWSVPGGAMEHGEHWNDTGIREVREETGLAVCGDLRWLAITNDVCRCGEHWVTIWLGSPGFEGEPAISDECAGYRWCSLDTLPAPLFQPCWENFLKARH